MELNMDNSPPVTSKPRRRSSFFERRTSAVMPVAPDASNFDLDKLKEELKQTNIELYMECLSKEKTDWEDCYKMYKSAYEDSKHRSKSPSNQEAPLLPEHAAFLLQRPDLSQLAKDVSSLTKSVSSLLVLRQRYEAACLRAANAQLEQGAPILQDILERSQLDDSKAPLDQ